MFKPKHFVALMGFSLLVLLAFMSTGISYGIAQPIVVSAVPSTACGVTVPDGSVVGAIIKTTPIYFAPNFGSAITNVDPLPAGKRWYVVGQDATHKFYEIYISCGFVWVPIDTMGVSNVDPGAGLPLPTRIVS